MGYVHPVYSVVCDKFVIAWKEMLFWGSEALIIHEKNV